MLEQSLQRVPGQPFVDVLGQTGNANSFLSDVQSSAKWLANGVEVWGNISNLLDKDPPQVGGGTGGTNPVFFDTIGRYYKVGVRLSF